MNADQRSAVALVIDAKAARSRSARHSNGWTSLRVDRATFARLKALARTLPGLLAGSSLGEAVDSLPMVELLELLSRARVADHPAEPPPPPPSLARRLRSQPGA